MRRRIRNSKEWIERQSQLSTELFCLAGDGCLGSSRFFDAVEAGQRERVLDSINRLVTSDRMRLYVAGVADVLRENGEGIPNVRRCISELARSR